MEATKQFYEFLKKFGPLSPDEYRQFVLPYLKIKKFARREISCNVGEVENYFHFIIRGLMRKYYVKGAEEITTQVSVEGQIIHSQESFHLRLPSEYVIEAIEPTSVISISANDLEGMLTQNQKMEHIGRKLVTFVFVLKERWLTYLVTHAPRERFLHFVTENPLLLQRVPQKYLASLLHIKPETFSRFKHLLKTHVRKKIG